jgi:hypothetical protein
MDTEIEALELLHFGAEVPAGHIGGIMHGLKPEVISAGSAAINEAARPGYHAGITALGAISHPGLGPHMHTRLQMRPEIARARAALPAEHWPGFDAAVSLVAGHARRWGMPFRRPLPPAGQAAYLIGHGMPDAGPKPEVMAAMSDAGPDAVAGLAEGIAERHHENAALRALEVGGGGLLAGGGTYYVLGLKTALALGAKAAVSGGVGLVVGGIIWALRHRRWDA